MQQPTLRPALHPNPMTSPSVPAPQLLELKLIGDYLDNAADSHSDHTATDYQLADTPVRRKLLRAANEHHARLCDEDVEKIVAEDGQLWTHDFLVFGYLSDRAHAFRDRLDKQLPTPVAREELEVIAQALAYLARNEFCEYATGRGEEGCHLPNTPEARAFAEAVIRHKGGTKVEATVKKMLANTSGPELFDTWVLAYLADRNTKLATVAPEKGIGFSEKDLPLQGLDKREEDTKKPGISATPGQLESPGISPFWLKQCKLYLKNT